MTRGLSVITISLLLAAMMCSTALATGVAEPESKTLVVSMDAEPATLNAHANAENYVLQVGHLVNCYLTALNPVDSAVILPGIAKSWDYLSDTELKFTLREDVYFHNDRQLTADDVVFTFDWTVDKNNTSVRRGNIAPNVEKVEKTGTFEVLMTLKNPYPPLLELLAFLPIISEDTVKTLATAPVGCGPFKFVRWDRDQQIVFESYEKYWAGPLQYDTLILRTFHDYNAEMTAFLAGEVDVFLWLSSVDVPTIEARSTDFHVQSIDDYAYYLSLNTQVEVLQSQKVRDAIKYAIDKKSAVNLVLKGKGTPISQPVASTNAYYNTDLDWELDLEKAKQSLTEAGYPNGLELTLSTQNTVVLRDLATVMKEQLEAAGFVIRLNVLESPSLFAMWNVGEAEIALGGYGLFNDPAYRSDYVLGSLFLSGFKRYGYNNPEYDALYREGLTTADIDKRKEIYAKLWELAMDDAGFYMLFSSTSYSAVANRVKGLVYRSSGNSNFTKITLGD